MLLAEFDKNMARLKDKWKNILSADQLQILWQKWKDLPDGVFDAATQMVLFKCTAIPSGERIQEEIDLTLQLRRKANTQQPLENNGCKSCSGRGYKSAFNLAGNESPFVCTTCGGKGVGFNFPMPTWTDVLNRGYSRKRTPLSFQAKKHTDWKEADPNKYSPKLIGIYNTVQRSMLTNDQRGMKGITTYLNISSGDAFKIYELITQNNTHDQLIKKHNQSLEKVL